MPEYAVTILWFRICLKSMSDEEKLIPMMIQRAGLGLDWPCLHDEKITFFDKSGICIKMYFYIFVLHAMLC